MTNIALKLNYPEKKVAFTEAYNRLPGKKLKEILKGCPLILVVRHIEYINEKKSDYSNYRLDSSSGLSLLENP
jgi:hypothetical protein